MQVYLSGSEYEEINYAYAEDSVIFEFEYFDGNELDIVENAGIIQFNSLEITRCGKNFPWYQCKSN